VPKACAKSHAVSGVMPRFPRMILVDALDRHSDMLGQLHLRQAQRGEELVLKNLARWLELDNWESSRTPHNSQL